MQATIPAEQNFSSTLDMGFISCCSAVSACALFMYDRVLTIGQEIRQSSGRRLSVASGLCFLMQLSTILYLWTYMAMISVTGCQSGNLLAVVLNIAAAIFHASSGAISALRTYAINGRSLHSPAVILVLSLVATSLDVYKTFTLVAIPVPQPVGCVILWTNSNAVVQSVVWLTGQVCSTVAESLALVVTWRTVYGMERRAHRLRMKLPVTTLLLKDGAMYFGMIIVVLIVNGVLNHIKSNSFTTPLTYTLESIIISRFFLNLREAALTPHTGTLASSPSQMSSARFSRVLGNLDGSLAHDPDTDETARDEVDQVEGDHLKGFEMENSYRPAP